MQIIADTMEFSLPERTAVAIGKFDGVHVGHRKLIERIDRQRQKGYKTCIFTFDPPPGVFFGTQNTGELTIRSEKREIFGQLGIDYLIEFPLTRESAAMEPRRFVSEILADKLKAGFVAAGEDLSFGKGGAGDAALLCELAKEYGFETEIIDKVCIRGQAVGSTQIRELLTAGDMEQTAELLGAAYSISGTVVYGRRLGHSLGVPTVNIVPDPQKALPPYGVYFSKVLCRGKEYAALSNIGCKPTVSSEKICGLETYLYDFDEEIYGEQISVSLYHFLRPEMAFADLEALRRRLMEDVRLGRAYWEQA